MLKGSTIALSMATSAYMRCSKGSVGEACTAGHQRPAQPAPALGLALVGRLGLEEQREGLFKAAEGRERPREIALFCLSLLLHLLHSTTTRYDTSLLWSDMTLSAMSSREWGRVISTWDSRKNWKEIRRTTNTLLLLLSTIMS